MENYATETKQTIQFVFENKQMYRIINSNILLFSGKNAKRRKSK